jgi:hypothetical protein
MTSRAIYQNIFHEVTGKPWSVMSPDAEGEGEGVLSFKNLCPILLSILAIKYVQFTSAEESTGYNVVVHTYSPFSM